MSVNKVILIGNVGREPNVRYYDREQAVASVTLATTERGYQLRNGTQVPDRTEWHNLVFWGGIAKTVEKYVHKGDKLYVEGTLRSRSYDDKNGVSRTIVEIYVNNMEMLSRNPQQGAAATTPSATQNPTVASGQSVDQPPF